ncbi:MAG: GlxA family transcriptional regulator [Gammaproteobacteria bacterium]|jgi:transcriptional regulator GlxA family with amidase domain|nr:GlxA family transcriptional regulator [Gammaproteobacteria bacterium]
MKKIVMLCVPPAQGVDVIGPLEAFGIASRMLEQSSGRRGYETELVTNSADLTLPTTSGVSIVAHRHYRQVRGKVDTLLIAGGPGTRNPPDAALLAWLRRKAKQARRVCSVCTGAFLLADAGLLRGKRATTHWRYVESFARNHPDVSWDPNPIWVQDGNIYTSAGISAGMDLSLALIEEDFGSALALDVARHMVIFLRRPGSQAQFSVALAAQAAERRCLQELQVWIAENLAKNLRVETLAKRAAMSGRNFARVFTRELGNTPARYVEQARVEAARTQLESTDDSVDKVARRCGFSSAELLRRCFLRQFKVAPSQYRRHFRAPGTPVISESRAV